MNALPNIHPVTLLLVICVRIYGARALYPAACFSLVEILLYGLSIWTAPYLYIWIISVLIMLPFRNNSSRLFWACLGGILGLCFGLFSAVPAAAVSGLRSGIAYWAAGISFDIIHCVSNFILLYFLNLPLYDLVLRIKGLGKA